MKTPAPLRKYMDRARERYKLGTESHDVSEQRKRFKEDLIFMRDQWPSEVRTARSGQLANNGLPPLPARPCLQIDKISYPIRQVLNEQRQADLNPKVVPADDFAGVVGPIDDSEIELREGLLRKILRESEASDAFSWAFSRSAPIGEGFFGVRTRYLPGATFDQEVYFERIFDQNTVVIDPSHNQPDGSDADWGFEGDFMPKDQYDQQYPALANGKRNPALDLGADDFTPENSPAPGWFRTDGDEQYIRVTTYWWTEYIRHSYALLTDGRVVDVADLKNTDTIQEDEQGEVRRDWIEKKIHADKIDGVNKLEETIWPARWIGIVKVLGDELHPVDGKRWTQGIVRPSRDGQMGFNAMVSSQVERVALTPLPPIMMAEGQDEGFEEEWKVANTRSLPALHYKQRDLEGNPAPPPGRPNADPNIQAISQSVALFDASIKSTTGVPDPTLGNVDPSLRSGNAVKALVAQSQRGTSNFMDNLIRSMRHGTRIANDLFPAIYNRPGRMVQIMMGDNKLSSRALHQAIPGKDCPVCTFTKGADFNIAISVVKNADTRRQEENALIGELISEDPQAMLPIIGDLYFQTMDSPGSKEMAARFKAVLNPAVAAVANGRQAIPPAAQQQIQQSQQMIENLTQHLNAAMQKIESKQVEKHADIIRAANDNATRLEIAKIQAGATLGVADIKASVEQIITSAKAEQEQLRLVIETAQEERMQMKDHMHAAAMAGVTHGHQRLENARQAVLDQATAAHQAGMDQAVNEHQNQLDMALASHQAAVAPQLSNGDGGSDDDAGS
jgi:hypothetical protein